MVPLENKLRHFDGSVAGSKTYCVRGEFTEGVIVVGRLLTLRRYFSIPRYRPSAERWRFSGFFSHCSSAGLLIKDISASTDGISAPTSTTKGALRTPRLRSGRLPICIELASDS